MSSQTLRPVERRIRQLAGEGVSEDEIAERFRRSPEWVRRVLAWSRMPRSGRPDSPSPLRPLERRVLQWRHEGADHDAIGTRFHRGGDFIEQVERMARYKLGE